MNHFFSFKQHLIYAPDFSYVNSILIWHYILFPDGIPDLREMFQQAGVLLFLEITTTIDFSVIKNFVWK